VYRQRVVELDPYAAQVTGTVFQSNEVSDAAISLEHLDWNGQPVGTGAQSDWSANQAISLESGAGRDEQPDWLRNAYADTTPPTSPSSTRPIDPTTGAPVPSFDASTPSAQSSSEELPDFLRAAGWGQSTGAFDESKPIFGSDEPAASQPIEQGEIPDWVKAMAPTEATQPTSAEEEELPDWINKIGTGSAPGPATSNSDQLDWMSQLGQTSEPTASEPATMNDLDWMSQLGQPAQPAPAEQASDDQLDWMKQLDQPASSMPAPTADDVPEWMAQSEQASKSMPIEEPSSDQPDWLNQLDQPASSMPASTSENLPDWMTQLDRPAPAEQVSDEQPDWMKQFDQPVTSSASSDQPDWLKQSDELASSLPTSDEQPDWMRPLDLTTPMEQVSDDQPDWLKQADQPAAVEASSDFGFLDQPKEEPRQEMPSSSVPSMQDVNNLGVSEQERDDSFAWLESLAAKQGASEGLLTKPEDRLEEEPDWVKQAKGLRAEQASAKESSPTFTEDESLVSAPNEPEVQLPAESTPISSEPPSMEETTFAATAISQPSGNLSDLGKSDQDRDDSFAWLENLAAKQGASEGLLTKPEDRLEKEPDWVTQAKDFSAPAPVEQPPVQAPSMTEVPPSSEPVSTPEPAANLEELGKSDQERDDSFSWLESLAAKQGASEGLLTKPEDRLEQEPDWVKQAKDLGTSAPSMQPPAQEEAVQDSAPSIDDTAAWLRSLDEEESTAPVFPRASDETGIWLKSLSEEDAKSEPSPISAADETGMWLKGLDEEESKLPPASTPSSDDTAMWLKSLSEDDAKPVPSRESGDDETGMWLRGLDEEESSPTPASTPSSDDTAMWLKSLSEEDAKPAPLSESTVDETAMWLKSLDEAEKASAQPEISEQPDLPAWMQNIEDGATPAEEPAPPSFVSSQDTPKPETGSLPSWLRGLEKTETRESAAAPQDDLPAWLRDETGEVVAEPTKIEPTRATDWQPAETTQPEPAAIEEPEPMVDRQSVEEKEVEPPVMQPPLLELEPIEMVQEEPAPIEQVMPPPEPEPTPAPPPKPYKEPVTRKGTGMLTMPGVDSILGSARSELSRSNIPGALETYAKLIKKGRFLDEVIHDLRDALYRYPVEVSIWQSLGDAYMRANRLQDALDSYTKAEELLR
jgi:hypothetical protein